MVLKLHFRPTWPILLFALVATCSVAHAQSMPEGVQPSQQRDQVREKLRSRWQAMTPQERDAAKLKLKQRYQSLSPEQKEKLLQRWRQRGASAPD